MTTDMSILSLFIQASPIVKLVMGLLLAASILSWTVIIQKYRAIRRIRGAAEAFEGRFWSGIDLVDLFRQVSKQPDRRTDLEAIFESGFREFARLHKAGVEAASVQEGTERALRVELSRQMDRLDTGLSGLATIGSTSPYVGLFGTVWGIMNSFLALGGVQHATMAMVAPGIAEALIATAMGLFAAIPAVIAYNRFSHDVERLGTRYENFAEEFSGVLLRQLVARRPKEESAAEVRAEADVA